eukprot:Seg2323.7 transcript_id=Seg2323.7/GoldUCD/mRNA.D3Y31 product="hypothetical protein" protein_id=Seg2323.7/GoldUCD/D3Y31
MEVSNVLVASVADASAMGDVAWSISFSVSVSGGVGGVAEVDGLSGALKLFKSGV